MSAPRKVKAAPKTLESPSESPEKPPAPGPRVIGIGIVGLGFMGRVHFEAYLAAAKSGEGCRLVAVSDANPERLAGKIDAPGNIQKKPASALLFDPRQVRTSTQPEAVFADPDVELVSICTPTDTHVELALRALAAKKHVLVEKPVSLDAGEIERLDLVARKAGRICMPAMCMRFWPGWTWLRDAVADRRYGAVKSAVFQRCASQPSWGAGFYSDSERSGGALFDLHVHDVDFVHQLFGVPDSVSSTGSIDHVTTHYRFAKGPPHVVAEGGWDHADGFPFRMRYVVAFENATAEFDSRREKPLEITRDGKTETAEIEPGTGYDGEVRHVLACVRAGKTSALATLSEAAAVTRTLLAEKHELSKLE
jgi:predicted dehydrogenase